MTAEFRNYTRCRKASDNKNFQYNDVNSTGGGKQFNYTAQRQINAFRNDPIRPHIGVISEDVEFTATYAIAAISTMTPKESHDFLRKYPFVRDCVKYKADKGLKFHTPKKAIAFLADRLEQKVCDHAELLKSNMFLTADEITMRDVLKQAKSNFKSDKFFEFMIESCLALIAKVRSKIVRGVRKTKKVLGQDGLTSEERIAKSKSLKKSRLKAPFLAMKAGLEEIAKRLEEARLNITEQKVHLAMRDNNIDPSDENAEWDLADILRGNYIAQNIYGLVLLE